MASASQIPQDSTNLPSSQGGLALRYQVLCRQGLPDLQEFLKQQGDLSATQLLEVCRVDQQERWRRGEGFPAEAYFRLCPTLQVQAEQALDLVYGEYLLREQGGEKPSLTEYLQRFPSLAGSLQQQVEFHRALGQSSSSANGGTSQQNGGPKIEAGGATKTPPLSMVDPRSAIFDPRLTPGPAVPGHEIVRELGRGGMGVVYLARQTALKRLVALKMLRPGRLAGSGELARFRGEAEVVARLRHPNIIQIHEVGELDGCPYFSLEYADGGSLADQLRGVPQPPPQAAALVETLARAVDAAHQHGIVHRDLKPANVLLQIADCGLRIEDQNNQQQSRREDSQSAIRNPQSAIPKIADFGLAKRLDDDSGQTRSGDIMGTPSYMAPEQAAGRIGDIGAATDVYSLGAILYELLTGRPPFRAASPLDTLAQVLADEPVPPRRLQPKTPRDLETICLKCLQKEPRRRYPSGKELADDLARFLAGEPIRARPVGRAERLGKWVRRRPALAALITVMIVAGVTIPAILVGSNVLLQESASREKDRADEAQSANTRYLAQLLETRRSFYVANLRQAQLAASDLQPQRVAELLDELLPPQDQPDLRGFEWHYLRRLSQQGQFTCKPYHQLMSSIAFSPDGRRLLTASIESPVRMFDTATGKEVATLKAPYASTVAFSPDGSRVLTLASNGSWQLWDPSLPKPIRTYQRKNLGLTTAVFSPDGKLVAGHDSSDGIILWDAQTGRQLETLRAPAPIRHLAFSPNGAMLAAGTGLTPADEAAGAAKVHAVVVWDLATRMQIGFCRGHTDQVVRVVFSPDGRLIASASKDYTVKVWETEEFKETLTFAGHAALVDYLIFSPDPRRRLIASVNHAAGDEKPIVLVWDAETGRELFKIENAVPLRARVAGQARIPIAFRPDGLHLATGGPEGTVVIYESTTGREVQTLRLPTPMDANGFRPIVTTLAYSPDDRCLAAGLFGGWVFLWERGVGRDGFAGRAPAGFSAFAFRADGNQAVVGGADGRVFLWDPNAAMEVKPLGKHGAAIRRLAFSTDGTRVASSDDGRWVEDLPVDRERVELAVKVWDTAAGKELFAFKGIKYWVERLAFSPDGRWLVTAGQRNFGTLGETKVWDLSTGKEAYALPEPRGMDSGVAFSPDSKLLATANTDQTIRLWDAATGQEVRALRGHKGAVFDVTFSPDGKYLASGGYDHTVRVWDVATGRELFTLAGHLDHVLAVAFSPDGTRLVSGGQDRTLRIWDLATRKELLALRGLTQFVSSISFSPDGRRLLSNGTFGTDGRRVELLDAKTMRPIQHAGTGPDPRVWDAGQ